MANKHYTILVVPDRSSIVRRLKISKRLLAQGVFGLCILLALGAFMFVHYLYVVDQVGENQLLRQENLRLNNHLRVALDRVERIAGTVERVERFDVKLREITRLNDPERRLAMGPLQPGEDPTKRDVMLFEGESANRPAEPMDSKLGMQLLDGKIETLDSDAKVLESSLRELQEYFEDQKSLLTTTPSITPSRGWLTSSFGARTDPYTGEKTFHKGLDLAGPIGTPIWAPSDGTVIYVGNRGGYGKTIIIDHGYGLQSHYGHLSEFMTKVGDYVRRGQVIGNIGNTGRSTGPHLHYEVRILGVPQNPRKYILD